MAKAGIGDILRFLFRKQLAQEAGDRTDGDLLKQFAATREDRPFTVLFERHAPMVMSVCKRILGDFHQAEDSLQATFHILARRAGYVRWRECLGPWLYAVARRVALRARAKRLAQQNLERRSANMPPTPTIDDTAWNDLSSVIDEEIGRLPAKYRAPLILSYLESKSRSHVAKELGWPEGTVARRLERGRELLRVRLVKRGITLSAAALAATLPEKLAAAPVPATLAINTIKAATVVAAGQTSAGGFISAQALLLAEETMKGMLFVKAQLALILLTVSVALGGAGWAGYKALAEPGQTAPVTKEQEKAQVIQAKSAVATDIYGDPLPAGAVARLGTVRFLHEGGGSDLVFTSDGKTLVMATNLAVHVWDSSTGKERFRLPNDRLHTAASIAVSPDGLILAIALQSHAVNGSPIIVLHDLTSGKTIRKLQFPEENKVAENAKKAVKGKAGAQQAGIRSQRSAGSIAFSKDGKQLAAIYQGTADDLTGGFGGGGGLGGDTAGGKAVAQSVIFFDVAAGEILTSFEVPDGHIDLRAWSTSTDQLAVMISKNRLVGGELQLWDMAKQKALASVYKTNQPVRGITVSTDGKKLALTQLQAISIFDVTLGKLLVEKEVDREVGAFLGSYFYPDGSKLITIEPEQIVIRDATSLAILNSLTFQNRGVQARGKAAISPDGKRLALLSGLHKVQLWDLEAGKRLFTEFQGHDDAIKALIFSPDGKTLVSSGDRYENGIFFWDPVSGKRVNVIPGFARDLVFSGDGAFLAWHGLNQTWDKLSDVHVWSVREKKEVLTFPAYSFVKGARSGINSVKFSWDGHKLFTLDWTYLPKQTKVFKKGNITPFVRHWGATTGKALATFPLPEQSAPPQSTSGNDLATLLAADGDTVITELADPQPNKPGEVNPRGRGRNLEITKLSTGKKTILAGKNNDIGRVFAVSPDARLLAHGIDKALAKLVVDKKLGIKDAVEKDLQSRFSGVRLWELETGKEIRILEGQPNAPNSIQSGLVLAWSHDGRLLATVDVKNSTQYPGFSDEGNVRVTLWDTASGSRLAQFNEMPGFVQMGAPLISALAFSPNDAVLAVGRRDTTILLYDISKFDPKLKPGPKLNQSDLESRWKDLDNDNATLAHQAIGALILSPKDSLPFLKSQLKPVPAVDPAKIKQWLADLNSEVFAVRQSAANELEKAGDQAVAPIQKILKESPSLEARRRLEQIVTKLANSLSSETTRTIRAIMVLERNGSSEAQIVLETLARGAPGARETEEAKASLARSTPVASKMR